VSDPDAKYPTDDHGARLEQIVAEGDPIRAANRFMRKGIAMPAPLVARMTVMPTFKKFAANGLTLRFDYAALGEPTCTAGRPRPGNGDGHLSQLGPLGQQDLPRPQARLRGTSRGAPDSHPARAPGAEPQRLPERDRAGAGAGSGWVRGGAGGACSPDVVRTVFLVCA
jgi:hypothetical protein